MTFGRAFAETLLGVVIPSENPTRGGEWMSLTGWLMLIRRLPP